MGVSLPDSILLGVPIVMVIGPAVFLMCVADGTFHKCVAVLLFVISLMGLIELKCVYDTSPKPVTNLYNYGDEVK